jgi:hypothetical protein
VLSAAPINPGIITVTANPQLGLPQKNGGLTETMALTSSSPEFGKGNAKIKGHVLPRADQRGLPRVVNGRLDLGAFEVQH